MSSIGDTVVARSFHPLISGMHAGNVGLLIMSLHCCFSRVDAGSDISFIFVEMSLSRLGLEHSVVAAMNMNSGWYLTAPLGKTGGLDLNCLVSWDGPHSKTLWSCVVHTKTSSDVCLDFCPHKSITQLHLHSLKSFNNNSFVWQHSLDWPALRTKSTQLSEGEVQIYTTTGSSDVASLCRGLEEVQPCHCEMRGKQLWCSGTNQDQARHEQETAETPETRCMFGGVKVKLSKLKTPTVCSVCCQGVDVTLSDGTMRDDGYFSSNQHIINNIQCCGWTVQRHLPAVSWTLHRSAVTPHWNQVSGTDSPRSPAESIHTSDCSAITDTKTERRLKRRLEEQSHSRVQICRFPLLPVIDLLFLWTMLSLNIVKVSNKCIRLRTSTQSQNQSCRPSLSHSFSLLDLCDVIKSLVLSGTRQRHQTGVQILT